ncbi:hypothetical protein DB42_DF00010 [Neochlamydia sp. EPS4]|uniref:hypothetical protein n=1 Tax=Neochlamydia sp. EPS4 TaxID=1478175 RepID=UPI0005826A44|nr:hypothetical protein [Neochlamydia sp. EPS4]KIC72287.1 hypothetical protein DB42_DF00010 [Neochlamydia sp. EPS4]
MTPTFFDFFKSFYYSNTYVPSVDLSEQRLSRHLLENEDNKAAATAQRLISDPEVQQVLSEPLVYDREKIIEKNQILTRHGFNLLSNKPLLDVDALERIRFYSVIEHDELDGWIIKSGASRVPKDQLIIGPMNDRNEMAFFIDEESILRIEMTKRIQKVAREANIDVVLPRKKLVVYANLDGVTEPNRKYCVVCEKINILSVEDTVQAIKDMDVEHQREIARKISTIVQKAGFVDASFDNIRLTPAGKLAFIDTEPAGLMVAKKPGLWNKLFGPKGASVEKCARIGLFTLMHQTSKVIRGTQTSRLDARNCEPGLEAFRTEVQTHYEKATPPKLLKWKIALSVVSVGLIPLINAIIALVKTKLTKRTFEKLQAIDTLFMRQVFALTSKSPGEQKRLVKEYQEKRTSIAKQFYAYTEGVPYKVALVV